jgi:hypothetical protein
MSRGVLLGLCVAISVVIAAPARAQSRARTELSARKVEVGERFNLKVTLPNASSVTGAELKLPPGVESSRPSVGTQMHMDLTSRSIQQTATVTWTLRATQPGTFQLGPAQIKTESGQVSGSTVSIEVLPEGSVPKPVPPLAGDPFDPFDMLRNLGRSPLLPGFPPNFDDDFFRDQLPPVPEEFRVEHAPDPVAFLRARATPRRVVVGEQVNLSVLAYGSRGGWEATNASEPSRSDFIAYSLMDATRQLPSYLVEIDGRRYSAAKIADFALFPIKAGQLKAGAMSMGFGGRNYAPNNPLGLPRRAEAVEISVVEPPLAGRPSGYRLGDVGRYTLTASVEPRQVEASGSISVVAKLEGVGNVPASLLLPEQRGVQFLEPQLLEQVAPRNGVVQGSRTFTYVVELREPGSIDLGELTLPYYDPKARAYAVARAALGTVTVTGTAKPPSRAAEPSTHAALKEPIRPPAQLGASAPAPRYLASTPAFWAMLLGLPLLVVFGFAVSDAARLARARLSQRKSSLDTAIEDTLQALAKPESRLNPNRLAALAERALLASIEKATGVKARGLLKSELAPALSGAGLAQSQAESAARLLVTCDELRFAGEAIDVSAFAAEVQATCAAIARRKPARPAEAS